jgi:hypothetical protein
MGGKAKAHWVEIATFIVALAGLFVGSITIIQTRSTIVASNRAWLVPIGARLAEPLSELSRLEITLKNEGKTPAVDIRQIDEKPSTLKFTSRLLKKASP